MAEYRLFNAVTGGNREDDPGALSGVSLGTEFYILNNSGRSAIKLWYWHPVGTGDTAQRIGRIYRVSDLAIIVDSVTFPVGTSGTWVSVDIPAAALTANVRYKAVIWHPNGHFALTAPYWNADRIVNDLVGVSHPNATGGGQCTYAYGPAIQYPTGTFDRSNYWIDVTISDTTDQTATPAGIAPTAAFGTPTLTPGAVTLAPAGIPAGTVLGQAAAVPGAVSVSPAGIAPTAGLGRPVVAAAAPLGRLTAVASTVTLASGNSASVTIPADGSVQTGDLLILACVMPSGSRTFTVSGVSGFTSLTAAAQSGHTSEVWWHTVRAGDLGQTVTVTPSTGAIRQALLLAKISGAHLATPVAGSAKNTTSTTSTTKTTPSLAGAPAGSREIGLAFDSRGALTPQTANWTAPAGHTRALQAFTTSGSGASSGAMGDSNTLVSGTIGSRAWTADQQALGSAWTIAVAAASQFLTPPGVAPTTALGQPAALPGAAAVTPAGVASAAAFGHPNVIGDGSDGDGAWVVTRVTGPSTRWTARDRPGRWKARPGGTRWTARDT